MVTYALCEALFIILKNARSVILHEMINYLLCMIPLNAAYVGGLTC